MQYMQNDNISPGDEDQKTLILVHCFSSIFDIWWENNGRAARAFLSLLFRGYTIAIITPTPLPWRQNPEKVDSSVFHQIITPQQWTVMWWTTDLHCPCPLRGEFTELCSWALLGCDVLEGYREYRRGYIEYRWGTRILEGVRRILGRQAGRQMNFFFFATSRNFLPTFQTLGAVGVQFAHMVAHFALFKVQASEKGVLGWAWGCFVCRIGNKYSIMAGREAGRQAGRQAGTQDWWVQRMMDACDGMIAAGSMLGWGLRYDFSRVNASAWVLWQYAACTPNTWMSLLRLEAERFMRVL